GDARGPVGRGVLSGDVGGCGACGLVDREALSVDAGGFDLPDTGDRGRRLGPWPRFGCRGSSRREGFGRGGFPRAGGLGNPDRAGLVLDGERRPDAGVPLDLLDLDQGRELLADLVGHLRQAVDVLLEAWPLAPAIPLGELRGQLVEAAIVAGTG